MIHTRVFTAPLRGLKPLMEPKDMIRPRGMAPSRVRRKISRDLKKPSFRLMITVWNMANLTVVFSI